MGVVERPSRIVEFHVVTETVTTDELVTRLGQPDDLSSGTRRFPNKRAWVIRRSSASVGPVDTLIDAVLARIATVRDEIAELSHGGATTLLRIIEYIGSDEQVGPGFSLDASAVQLLAELGAFLDADLYGVGGQT